MELILGIDFGTTNTVISYFDNNKTHILKDGNYKSIPSKIGIKNNNLYFGNYLPLDCDKIYNNFKTIIGNNEIKLELTDIILTESDILIYFFNHLKKIIIKNLKKTIFKTVITVPSNFNNNQREIIRDNFNKCGFNVIRIINEPSAAALAYGLNHINDEEERILVIDLGGGTLDLTILTKENSFFEIEHSIGINDLGGNNFTDVIYNFIKKKYINIDDKKNKTLWYVCQNVKEKLSYLDEYEIKFKNYNDKNENLSEYFDNKIFNRLSYDILEKYQNILESIKNAYEHIKYIIMVGNSSKIPMIQDKVYEIFNIKPWIYPNLESVVAEGACLYGAIGENIFLNNNNVLLVDVVPLSLGVETYDGNFSIIIPKNTPLPIKRTQKYTSDTPFENSIKIKVYQGERKIANKNTLIGEFEFDKVSYGCKPIIDITFRIDLNGIISITVLDRKSNIEKNVLIKDIPIFNEDELNDILSLAKQNEKLDEEENLIKNRLYLIKNKIEIILNNLKLNELMDKVNKDKIINEILELESKTDNTTNSTELLNILKEIDDKYIIFTNVQNYEVENKNDEINETIFEEIIFIEKKEELFNKVTLLLHKNPEWEEYLQPILDELNYTNITKDYIIDKLEIIKDLEDNDEDNTDFKDQLNNLCLFLKSEIELGNLDISLERKEHLSNLINNTIDMIENDNDETDWENELKLFNINCESIYNLT
jgi:molecular chaperone DnaK